MRPPEFWNHHDGRDAAPMIRTLLAPFSWIYGWAAARRIKTADSYDVGLPVICIGNATMGGTGKTPVAIYLLKSLRRLGIEAVGLTRGYGGQEKGPIPVNANHTALDVGDEPLLLARHAPVWVSAGRDEGARAARSTGRKSSLWMTVTKTRSLKKRYLFLSWTRNLVLAMAVYSLQDLCARNLSLLWTAQMRSF